MWWKKRVYLDWSAGVAGNPSSPHGEGRRAKKMLEDVRETIARLVEVQSDDVVFTSGATESNALAIVGYVRALRELAGPDVPGRNNMHVLYLPSAHASIVENVKLLEEEGVAIEALPIKDARVDTAAVAKMLRPETVLVSMDAVCGETGVVWNTREVGEVLKKARAAAGGARIMLHVDASQAPWTEKITRDHFGADMLTLDASKVAAIHGCGVLIAHRTIPITPFYRGGGQERGVRPGTEVPELASAFAAALRAAALGRDSFRVSAERMRTQLTKFISTAIPDAQVNESRIQAPNILNLSLSGRDTDYLVALLDEAGFAVSTRSACETDSAEGSRAVFVLTGDQERARTTLRISWGPSTRARDVGRFAKALRGAVAFIDSNTQR
ncbi:MAG: aminotransferase class V-fold PLP-dependent enzyme [Minisyncoccia bacterium]